MILPATVQFIPASWVSVPPHEPVPAVVENDLQVDVAEIVTLPDKSSAIQSSEAVGGPESVLSAAPTFDQEEAAVQVVALSLR